MLMHITHAFIKHRPPKAEMASSQAFYGGFKLSFAHTPVEFARKNDPWEFMNSLSFQSLSSIQRRRRPQLEKFLIDALQDAMYLKSLDICVMTGLDVGMLSRRERDRR